MMKNPWSEMSNEKPGNFSSRELMKTVSEIANPFHELLILLGLRAESVSLLQAEFLRLDRY